MLMTWTGIDKIAFMLYWNGVQDIADALKGFIMAVELQGKGYNFSLVNKCYAKAKEINTILEEQEMSR